MFDLVSIGTISADLYFSAEDLTTHQDRLFLAIGGKYRSEDFRMTVGGGGANVAIGGKKNGLRTAVVGLVGNTVFRKGIMQRLQSSKINTSHLLFNQTAISVSVILLQENGERTVIAHQSSHEHVLEEAHLSRRNLRTRAVYFGNLSHVSVKERSLLMKKFKDQGVEIFVNVGPLECCKPKTYIAELLSHADVLMVNAHEFSDLVKVDIRKIDFKKSVLHLLPSMKDKIVIVTNGKNGSYGCEGNNVFTCPAKKEKKVVDTTGVGDGYTAGFISSYLKNADVLRAMKSGARYSAKILQKIGAN